MKTLKLILHQSFDLKALIKLLFVALTITLLWLILPQLLTINNSTVGLLDGAIWQLLLFSLISFMMLFSFIILLFRWLVMQLALPPIHLMVLQFRNLTTWQQYVFYWASFALFLLSAIACLAAVF